MKSEKIKRKLINILNLPPSKDDNGFTWNFSVLRVQSKCKSVSFSHRRHRENKIVLL